MGSKRTIITLSEEDKSWLEAYGRAYNLSLAEAIRRGISKLKESEESNTYRELVNATKGVWKKGDGLEYQKKMRSEWDPR
ncbi:MAG: hypothetical protein ABII26_08135 [Pseudomonadota bacterium]